MLVNQDRDGHRSQPQQINRVVKYRPVKLLPLREKSATFWMLLLSDTKYRDVTSFNCVFKFGVPTWYVSTAASSPRCKMDQENLLATKLRKSHRLSIVNSWQQEIWMLAANLWSITLPQQRNGDETEHQR
ncbi:MAG: hypothetical protein ACI9G1_000382 [Pirellulaceae bacterium]|jgi:hypothetical protein